MPQRGEKMYDSPSLDLRIDVSGAHLAPLTDGWIDSLARSAAQPGAVLPREQAHFVTWIQGRTSEQIEQQRAERFRSNRNLTRHDGWTLDLAVIVDGSPVGLQSLSGFEQWPKRRIVGTTSWLLTTRQRRGLGTRCRAAVLELAFAHLGATIAKSWALAENEASNAVSAKLGYREVDRHALIEDGREFTESVWQLERERWLASSIRREIAPAVSGADGIVTLLGGP